MRRWENVSQPPDRLTQDARIHHVTRQLKIDFVSDVVCPWCIIGLRGLQLGLERTSDIVQAEIAFQPFELNSKMPAEGQNIVEHVTEKYGSTPEQSRSNRAMIRERAAGVGFDIHTSDDSRIYNTFDAHRLLFWSKTKGKQEPLELALFKAYFTDGENVSDAEVLAAAALSVGLDAEEARDVLSSGRYAKEVRDAQQLWLSRGIHSVPAIVVNDKWLISGGQPPEIFEGALRNIAEELSRTEDRA
jgi:predicted DsbA family dithiol-disulfide isomerase